MPTNSPEASRTHDVLIVGGGLVGASLAIALDPLGLDVGLVDAGVVVGEAVVAGCG